MASRLSRMILLRAFRSRHWIDGRNPLGRERKLQLFESIAVAVETDAVGSCFGQ
jgi:hypothetical protein